MNNDESAKKPEPEPEPSPSAGGGSYALFQEFYLTDDKENRVAHLQGMKKQEFLTFYMSHTPTLLEERICSLFGVKPNIWKGRGETVKSHKATVLGWIWRKFDPNPAPKKSFFAPTKSKLG